jgi:hypothetical protein
MEDGGGRRRGPGREAGPVDSVGNGGMGSAQSTRLNTFFLLFFLWGVVLFRGLIPRVLRTAHR